MRALIQRVRSGSVIIEGEEKSTIGRGYVVLLGVVKDDDAADAAWLARKTANLRIFEDEQEKMNLSVKDVGGELLVVSQFTLYADARRGNRPGFEQAAPPEAANKLYEQYISDLSKEGLSVKTGTFQADMLVNIENDGPVTIMLESPAKGEQK